MASAIGELDLGRNDVVAPTGAHSRRQRRRRIGRRRLGAAPGGGEPEERVPIANRTPYGACVQLGALQDEFDYRNVLQTYCQQLTPEGGLFWIYLRPTAAQFRFDFADAVLAFAEANNMSMVGHTLVWYGAMPDWTKDIEVPQTPSRR